MRGAANNYCAGKEQGDTPSAATKRQSTSEEQETMDSQPALAHLWAIITDAQAAVKPHFETLQKVQKTFDDKHEELKKAKGQRAGRGRQ